jgi:hypothetical protein
MVVSDRTGIDADHLRALLEGHRPVRVNTPPPRPEGPEVEALRLAVHRPEEVAPLLHEALFADPVVLAGYRALCAAATLAQAIDLAAGGGDLAEPEAASLLQRLAVEEPEASTEDVTARLAEEAGRRVIARMGAAARRSGELTDDVAWLMLTMAELRDPVTGVDATGRLVRWLVDRFEVEA